MLVAVDDRQLLVLFGDSLRRSIADRNVTQQWLAERLGCSPAAVSTWLAGRRDMGVPNLIRIALLLGEAPGDLLPDVMPPAAPAGAV